MAISKPKEFEIDGDFKKLIGYEVLEDFNGIPTIKLEYYLEELITNQDEMKIKIID